jgi:hypothetical protein
LSKNLLQAKYFHGLNTPNCLKWTSLQRWASKWMAKWYHKTKTQIWSPSWSKMTLKMYSWTVLSFVDHLNWFLRLETWHWQLMRAVTTFICWDNLYILLHKCLKCILSKICLPLWKFSKLLTSKSSENRTKKPEFGSLTSKFPNSGWK